MSYEPSQKNTQSASTDVLKSMRANALNPEMDLEKFLDDDYLKSEPLDESPVELAECRSRRGSTGHAWQS